MTTGFSPFPDIEAAVAVALRTAGIGDGKRVYSSIPKNPSWPLAVVQRLGGGVVGRGERLDQARIQVDCWGANKATAWQMAEDVRMAMLAIEGTTITLFNTFVTGVSLETGAIWLPDPSTGRDRYAVTFTVYAHVAS